MSPTLHGSILRTQNSSAYLVEGNCLDRKPLNTLLSWSNATVQLCRRLMKTGGGITLAPDRKFPQHQPGQALTTWYVLCEWVMQMH